MPGLTRPSEILSDPELHQEPHRCCRHLPNLFHGVTEGTQYQKDITYLTSGLTSPPRRRAFEVTNRWTQAVEEIAIRQKSR